MIEVKEQYVMKYDQDKILYFIYECISNGPVGMRFYIYEPNSSYVYMSTRYNGDISIYRYIKQQLRTKIKARKSVISRKSTMDLNGKIQVLPGYYVKFELPQKDGKFKQYSADLVKTVPDIYSWMFIQRSYHRLLAQSFANLSGLLCGSVCDVKFNTKTLQIPARGKKCSMQATNADIYLGTLALFYVLAAYNLYIASRIDRRRNITNRCIQIISTAVMIKYPTFVFGCLKK